jgi:serine/threonine-protein kinase HipA
MDREGRWRLSPAFDVTYAYNPEGRFTSRHQMSVAGKREGFTRDDLVNTGVEMGINRPGDVIDEVVSAVSEWPRHAAEAGVDRERTDAIAATRRLGLA